MKHKRHYIAVSLALLIFSISAFSQWTWKQATIPATLKPQRCFHRMLSYDNKLWVFPGVIDIANHYQLARNTFTTTDGINWTSIEDPSSLNISGYYDCAVFNDYMWIVSGGDLTTG